MYRHSNLNCYTRLKLVHWAQKTEAEYRVFMCAQWPDQMMIWWISTPLVIISVMMMSHAHPMGMAANKDRTLLGGLSHPERHARNHDLAELFDEHKKLVAELRAEVGPRPDILAPPDTFAPWKDTHMALAK